MRKLEEDELIWESASGNEPRERGFDQDVAYCSQIDQYNVVPTLKKTVYLAPDI
jgi:2-phosphosulfolactate phosphatase